MTNNGESMNFSQDADSIWLSRGHTLIKIPKNLPFLRHRIKDAIRKFYEAENLIKEFNMFIKIFEKHYKEYKTNKQIEAEIKKYIKEII